MKHIKEKAAYLLLIIPTLTEWLETRHFPSDSRSIITDLAMTALVLFLILLSRKKDKKIKAFREEIKNRQMFDPLTGLPMRERFIQDLDQIIGTNKDVQDQLHLICIDIDHFRAINEEYGSFKGDEILKQLVKRIKAIIPEGKGHLYRLGGDTFGLFFSEREVPEVETIVSDLVTLNASGDKLLESYKSSITIGFSTLSTDQTAEGFWKNSVRDMQQKRNEDKEESYAYN